MIIDPDELGRALLIAWNREPVLFTLHIAQNFHLLLPSGFDEVRLAPGESLDGLDATKLAQDLSIDVLRLNRDDDITCGNLVWERFQRLEFRRGNSGAWYRFAFLEEGFDEDEKKDECFEFPTLCSKLLFVATKGEDYIKLDVKKLLESCHKDIDDVTRASVLLFPSIWTGNEAASNVPSEPVRSFLAHCQNEQVDFSRLTWRQMEELVAELLKIQGMKVTVTPASCDGGRDIIARYDLIPGEPTIIAVEVKHKPVVGIQDVRAALYANRQMPVLLMATSGRFSAGVIKESRNTDNRFRLFLKDGIALKQWIALSWERLAFGTGMK